MNTQPARLAVVEPSTMLLPRASQPYRSATGTSNNAAYRRLAAVILNLDVASLAAELSANRLEVAAQMHRTAA
jgi:hypothetical protein